MSKCNVTIELDDDRTKMGRGHRTFALGETLRGVVKVDVNEECECKNLLLSKTWKTHGQGNKETGTDAQKTLFTGTWAPGQYEYPFTWEVDDGPLTYRGNLLNIDWYLTASADIPWAFDPKTELDFVVTRGASQTSASHVGENVGSFKNMRLLAIILMGGMSAVMGTLFLLLGMFGTVEVNGNPDATYGGAVFMGTGALSICIPIVFLIRFCWSYFAEHRLGKVTFEVQPSTIKPGERVRCLIRFTPRKDLVLNKMSASLIAEEIVVSGSGTNSRTYRHTAHSQEQDSAAERRLHRGVQAELVTDFLLPKDAAPSFKLHHNELKWQVKIHLDIPKWPDWKKDGELFVD